MIGFVKNLYDLWLEQEAQMKLGEDVRWTREDEVLSQPEDLV